MWPEWGTSKSYEYFHKSPSPVVDNKLQWGPPYGSDYYVVNQQENHLDKSKYILNITYFLMDPEDVVPF